MSRGKQSKEVLTEAQCQALVSAANPRYPTGLRDRCMISLMLNTGIKVYECLTLQRHLREMDPVTLSQGQFFLSEMTKNEGKIGPISAQIHALRTSGVVGLNLQVHDIDWRSGKLMVRKGKANKDRTLWVNDEMLSLLRQWYERRPVDQPLLFTTLQGKPVSGRALRAMLKRRALKAGLTRDVHPFTLRRTFAAEMLRHLQDIRRIQKMLGHADLSTTMRYATTFDEDVEGAMKNFHLG